MLKKCVLGLIALFFIFGCSDFVYCSETISDRAVEDGRILTISDGISMVLRDSRLVKIEMSDKDMSFEDTVIALSPLLPHLSASMLKTYNQYTPTMIFGATSVPMGDKDPLSWEINISQTLFDFGKSISNYKASTEFLYARLGSRAESGGKSCEIVKRNDRLPTRCGNQN